MVVVVSVVPVLVLVVVAVVAVVPSELRQGDCVVARPSRKAARRPAFNRYYYPSLGAGSSAPATPQRAGAAHYAPARSPTPPALRPQASCGSPLRPSELWQPAAPRLGVAMAGAKALPAHGCGKS